MRALFRGAASILAAAHVAAALLPCSSPAQSRVAHDGHEHVVSDLPSAGPDDVPQLDRPCPCGCQGRSDPGLLGARLGWAEPTPECRVPSCAGWTPLVLASVALPAGPDFEIDPVPI